MDLMDGMHADIASWGILSTVSTYKYENTIKSLERLEFDLKKKTFQIFRAFDAVYEILKFPCNIKYQTKKY